MAEEEPKDDNQEQQGTQQLAGKAIKLVKHEPRHLFKAELKTRRSASKFPLILKLRPRP